jgi:hypothetical protein
MVILINFPFFVSEIFLHNEVDLALFSTLIEKDLLSLGIKSFGARKIMINIIKGTTNVVLEKLKCYY